MNALRSIFRPRRDRMTGCTPPTAAERMAAYSARYAEEMRQRENAGAALPKVCFVDGRPALVALDGHPNALPKDRA